MRGTGCWCVWVPFHRHQRDPTLTTSTASSRSLPRQQPGLYLTSRNMASTHLRSLLQVGQGLVDVPRSCQSSGSLHCGCSPLYRVSRGCVWRLRGACVVVVATVEGAALDGEARPKPSPRPHALAAKGAGPSSPALGARSPPPSTQCPLGSAPGPATTPPRPQASGRPLPSPSTPSGRASPAAPPLPGTVPTSKPRGPVSYLTPFGLLSS